MTDVFDLNKLIIDEDEIQEANVIQLSMFIYDILFLETHENIQEIIQDAHRILNEKFYFRKERGSKYREGFLHLEDIDPNDNKISCFYAKESTSKYVYANDKLEINEVRLRSITPSYSVKVNIEVNPKSIRCVLYGGNESLVQKALDLIHPAIRGAVSGFEYTKHELDQPTMWRILKLMGEYVAHIWIAPGDSDRFRNVIEKKEGNRVVEMLDFQVDTKLNGVRITNAPFVQDVLQEEGIYIKQIQGRISILGGAMTTRLSDFGRIIFYIPSYIIPKNGDVYHVGEELYERLMRRVLQGSQNG